MKEIERCCACVGSATHSVNGRRGEVRGDRRRRKRREREQLGRRAGDQRRQDHVTRRHQTKRRWSVVHLPSPSTLHTYVHVIFTVASLGRGREVGGAPDDTIQGMTPE